MARKCFLFGHRNVGEDILPELEEAVERHYAQYGVRNFIVGRHGSFDRLASIAIVTVKKRHDDIRATLLIPYYPADGAFDLPHDFDDSLYPQGLETTPPRLAIIKANELMVKSTDTVICCVSHPGNAAHLLEMALRQQDKRLLIVENIE